MKSLKEIIVLCLSVSFLSLFAWTKHTNDFNLEINKKIKESVEQSWSESQYSEIIIKNININSVDASKIDEVYGVQIINSKDSNTKKISGHFIAKIIYSEKFQTIKKEISIDGEIDVIVPVVTSKKTITPFQKFSSENLISTLKSVNEIYGNYIPEKEMNKLLTENYYAKKIIKEGELLTLESLQKTNDVKFGELLTLRIKSGNVTITTKGKAIENGYVGESLKIKRIDRDFQSSKIVIGKLISKDVVEVSL